jgi:hypothetical protein
MRRNPWRAGNYRAFANSAAKALRGVCSRSLPPRFRRSGRCCCWGGRLTLLGDADACCGDDTRGASLPLGGCAGLARSRRSSKGARSKRRIMDAISSAVGASTKAKPLDSCVSWLRITFTASATRSSAASHCLMSSAVTHVGRLPRKTVKLKWLFDSVGWICGTSRGESDLPFRYYQTGKNDANTILP